MSLQDSFRHYFFICFVGMNAQQILQRIDRLDNQIDDLNRDIAAEALERSNATDLDYKTLLTQGINKSKETLDRCVDQLGSLQGKSSLM